VTERTQTWLGVVLVGLLAMGALASTAGHANTTTTRLEASGPTRDAQYSDAGYSCLETKGHQLIRPTDRVYVYVAQADLNSWVILTKVLGGWAHLQAHRSGATVAVLLVKVPQRDGSIDQRETLLTIRTTRSGRVLMAGGAAHGSCAT
jgi:hypothetical protein